MNIVVACMVFFLAATQAWPEETEGTEGKYWPSQDQNQADLEDPAYDRYLQRIARKLKPDHFYGVMGKRKSESKRISPKRQKAEPSFIGLMGKRSLSSESEERNTDYDYRRRRK